MSEQKNQSGEPTVSKEEEEKIVNSLTNPDLGRESWLGQQEQSFSTKLLVIVGGIGSFGGLFPLFLEKFTGSSGEKIQLFFILFSIAYFVLPLTVYLLWVAFTDRVGFPELEDGEKRSDASWVKRLLSGHMWITHRYFVLIGFHLLLVTIFIICTSFVGPARSGAIYLTGLLPFIAPVIAVSSMSKKWAYFGFSRVRAAFGLSVAAAITAFYLLWGSHTQPCQNKLGFESLVDGDKIIETLAKLEDNISNRVDRFAIKSSIQKEVTLGIKPKEVDKTGFANYSIDPYLSALGKILLKDNSAFDVIDLTVEMPHTKDCNHKYEADSLTSRVQRRKDELKTILKCDTVKKEEHKHFSRCEGIDALANPHLFFDPRLYYRELDSKTDENSLKEMLIIDHIINDMMDTKCHRIFPVCLKSDTNIKEDKNVAASIINFENSQKLKDWVDNLYLPYCQRKAKSDIDEITAGVQWIHADMYMRGVTISIATLCLLLLCYSELWFLKRSEVASREKKMKVTDDPKRKEALGKQISTLNKNSAHLLFPLTMIITIVGTLSLRVGADLEAPTLDASSNFRMSSVPTLKLKETSPATPGKAGTSELKPEVTVGPGKTDSDVKRSIDQLNQQMKELETDVDSLGNMIESKHRGMTDEEWERWYKKS